MASSNPSDGNPSDAEQRRAYRRELRGVARLLRYSGIALALVGATGLVLAGPGAWWLPPSWISFAIGWALILAGIVRRTRRDRVRSNEPPEA